MSAQDRWWLRSVGYEVYVRSFSDADGDGIGDLAGLRSRLDHLEALGIEQLGIQRDQAADCFQVVHWGNLGAKRRGASWRASS